MRLFILGLLSLFSGSNQLANMGPYDIVVEQLSNCSPEGGRTVPFEVHPYFVKGADGRKQQLFKANISFTFTKEEFLGLEVNNTFYMKKNNDFLLMYRFTGNMCVESFTYVKDLYNDFLEHVGAVKDECAIKPGNYSLADWTPLPNLPAPMLEYGTYKVIMRGFLNGEERGCLEAVGVVKPKTL